MSDGSDIVRVVDELSDALSSQIIELQARCDAQAVLILTLVKQMGGDGNAAEKMLETIRATALQKRLERIEDRSPALAAALDQRTDLSAVDSDLLKKLHFPPSS